MKILTLSIKRQYFDEILAGKKTTETREIRPNNASQYVYIMYGGKKYEHENDLPPDEEINGEIEIVPVYYDALKLITGARNLPKRPYIVVEVKGAEFYFVTDENDEQVVGYQGGKDYDACEIEYELGKIIEKSL